MNDIERLTNLKKKNYILIKSLFIYVIISIIIVIVFSVFYRENLSFIVIPLLIASIILFCIAKKINIEVKKIHGEENDT